MKKGGKATRLVESNKFMCDVVPELRGSLRRFAVVEERIHTQISADHLVLGVIMFFAPLHRPAHVFNGLFGAIKLRVEVEEKHGEQEVMTHQAITLWIGLLEGHDVVREENQFTTSHEIVVLADAGLARHRLAIAANKILV